MSDLIFLIGSFLSSSFIAMQLSKPLCSVGEFIFFPYSFLYTLGLIIIPYQLAKESMMLPPVPFSLCSQHESQGSSEIAAALRCLGTKPHGGPPCAASLRAQALPAQRWAGRAPSQPGVAQWDVAVGFADGCRDKTQH